LRIALMLSMWTGDADFSRAVSKRCVIGELTKQLACSKGFAIFPAPERLIGRAREAVRSSIPPVFEAMARCNPYPADHLEAAAYSQMVVKISSILFNRPNRLTSVEDVCAVRLLPGSGRRS
jgi:hypothetical protein